MSDFLIGTGLAIITIVVWLWRRHVQLEKDRAQLRAMMAFYRSKFEEEVSDGQ